MDINIKAQETYISELPSNIRELIYSSRDAIKLSYSPYSNFKVGAAILLSDGNIKMGSNQENAAFPVGICAERSVLSTVNLNDKTTWITGIAISYVGKYEKPLSPCGMCRQSILEAQIAQGKPIIVYMCAPDGKVIIIEDSSQLLPLYFS